MNEQMIVQQRLSNQRLAGDRAATAAELVAAMGAVQGQDYHNSKWALGQRMQEATDGTVEQEFNEGKILRTHVMRPTWHFVVPADIRWMLELTAPQVNRINATMYRKLELDEMLLARCHEVLGEALAGGRFLTREELAAALTQAGIEAEKLRLAYILHHLELAAVICSGPRQGKQFTYALLEERAPPARRLPYEEALAELLKRFFTSHGPATVDDFAWWSGLTKTQTRAGLKSLGSELRRETVGEQAYWLGADQPLNTVPSPTAHLLPNFDEYVLPYRERNPFLDPAHVDMIETRNPFFAHFLVIDGQILGTWRRDFRDETVTITLKQFVALSEAQAEAVRGAVERFGRFVGKEVVLEWI